jgi:hypothetical protein
VISRFADDADDVDSRGKRQASRADERQATLTRGHARCDVRPCCDVRPYGSYEFGKRMPAVLCLRSSRERAGSDHTSAQRTTIAITWNSVEPISDMALP